jgi:hypothetical protein
MSNMLKERVVYAMAGEAFLSLVLVACEATTQAGLQGGNVPFAIRVVDESVRGDVLQGPPDADRVPVSLPPGVPPGAKWLKREGGIEGNVRVEAHDSAAPDGKPIIAYTFIWSAHAADQFAALTRENIGRQLAVVVDGQIARTPVVLQDIAARRGLVVGSITETQAREVTDAIADTGRLPVLTRIDADQGMVQHVTFEGTTRADPSVLVERLSSTAQGPRNAAAVALGDALNVRFESGLFSDLRITFDLATTTRRIDVVQ